MPSISIDSRHLFEFREEALTNIHKEICGILVGRFLSVQDALPEDVSINVEKVVLIDNVAPEPLAAFTMDPNQLIKAMEAAYKDNLHVVGCIHSHPLWSSHYSGTDIARAQRNNDEAVWIIYGGRKDDYSAFYYDKKMRRFFDVAIPQLVQVAK